MLVAGARRGEIAVGNRACLHALRRGEHQGLDPVRDVFVGKPVIAMAALSDDAEQARVGQALQVRARGRGGDAGDRRELAGRPRAAVEEREHDRRARGLGEQCAELGELVAGDRFVHAIRLARLRPPRFAP